MKLQDIYIYPIKSLAGIRLQKSKVEIQGLEYDRRWMLVDKEGTFISQRTQHNMCKVEVHLQENGIKVNLKANPNNDIIIPYEPALGKYMDVNIWRDKVKAQEVDTNANNWFSEILKIPCKLVHLPKSEKREIDKQYQYNHEHVSFADSMPYMMIGQASLDQLNNRLKEKIPMNRFRPNFVFSGGEPFQEDKWAMVRIGNTRFKITKPCARCILTTIDQEKCTKGKEPLKTLATFRSFHNKIWFGQNMIAIEEGEVNTGDDLSPTCK